jgi:hypothetical protein
MRGKDVCVLKYAPHNNIMGSAATAPYNHDFSGEMRYRIQTCSGTHLTSNKMGPKISLSGSKAAAA